MQFTAGVATTACGRLKDVDQVTAYPKLSTCKQCKIKTRRS